MRKIVFEGVINGEKFDNVQDYNSRMQELISAGVTEIQATSSTHMVDEPEEKKVYIGANEKRQFHANDYIPFFNNGKHYLDQLVSDDMTLNEKNLAFANDVFEKSYNNLKDILKDGEVGVNEALDLANLLKEIRSQIEIDSNENRNAVNELTERISADTRRLQLLNNAKPVFATVSDYYEDAFELVKRYLLGY